MNEYETNWTNIDLDKACNQKLNLLESYTFEILLLEISCNMRTEDITAEKVLKHAQRVIAEKAEEAKEILRYNIKNIVKQAKKGSN